MIDHVIRDIGFQTFYPGPLDDIGESMRLIDGRALCAGVINDIRLIDWSPDQIRAEVKRIIHAGLRQGRKFFFGTVVMPYGIPERNIMAMIDAAHEFGRMESLEEG